MGLGPPFYVHAAMCLLELIVEIEPCTKHFIACSIHTFEPSIRIG
jgi:hypothetical protein